MAGGLTPNTGINVGAGLSTTPALTYGTGLSVLGSAPPPSGNDIIDRSGNFILTRSGNNIVTR